MKFLVLALCVVAAIASPRRMKIPELAEKLGATTLVDLVKAAGLAETLSGEGPFTVAGPTNKAFDDLPKAVLDMLRSNKTALTEVLTYHVHAGLVLSTDATNDELFTTVQGTKARFNMYANGAVTINGAMVDTDAVDQRASNGVIHVMDKVIYPIPSGDVTTVATSNPDFSTLVTALEKADLVDTLKGMGPFTVFAPTNAAFAKIPADELRRILADKDLLTSILLYHVLPGTVYSAGLTDGMNAETLAKKPIRITVNDNGVMINRSKVTMADISGTNGVVHVIDTVLIPMK